MTSSPEDAWRAKGKVLGLTLIVGLLCGGAGAEETLHTLHEPSAPIPPDTVEASADFPTPLVSPEDSRPNPVTRGNSVEATPASHSLRFQPVRRVDRVFRHGPSSGRRRSDAPLYAPYTAWEIRPGDNRVLGNGQVMLPLWQTDDSLLFADLRGQTDDSQSREGNWGLGLRQILNNDMIVGGYGFYDLRRTEFDNEFDQLTFGLEALTVQWEARVNGYLAESGAKAVNGRPGVAAFRNGTIVLLGTTERAYSGFDAEIGGLLREWYGGDLELRGFIGGYHFDNDATGFRHVSGPRARLELRAYDLAWLGDQSRVTLGAEWQWDQVRDDQVFAMLRVRIPLGGGGNRRRPTRLERRMLDRVVRDVDVVTEAPPTAQESALYADTGQPVGPVTLVDANTPNPSGTVAGAGAGGTVIVDGAQGGIQTDTPIVLQDGQTVRGAGFDVAGRVTGARSTFGTRPTVNGSDSNENVFEIADNSVLRDLNVTGGERGVFAHNVNSFRISGLHISGADITGLEIVSNTSDFTVTGNTASNNRLSGFGFEGISGGTITGNTANNNGEEGFDFDDFGDATLSNNTASNNGEDGFEFDDISGGTITGNTATGNDQFGFQFDEISGGVVTDNTATDNGEDGFNFEDISGGTITGNTATGNDFDGFDFSDVSGGTITNNAATGNEDDGFEFFSISGGTITNNTATDNEDDGFQITDVSGGTISNNTATGNDEDGFDFSNVSGGTITNNTASNNGDHGFDFFDVSGGTITNNTATGNEYNGFIFSDIGGGTFAGNTATGNKDGGFDFFRVSGGTITNNTATGNENDGFILSNVSGGSFSNNSAAGNGQNGFLSISVSGGTITGNIASDNDDAGFQVFDFPVGNTATFTDNEATDNGGSGYDINSGTPATGGNNTGSGNLDKNTGP